MATIADVAKKTKSIRLRVTVLQYRAWNRRAKVVADGNVTRYISEWADVDSGLVQPRPASPAPSAPAPVPALSGTE